MIQIYSLIPLLFILTCASSSDSQDGCYSNKGIKIAKSYTANDYEDIDVGFQETHYDKNGKPTLSANENNGTKTTYNYQGAKLIYIINESNRPDFYDASSDYETKLKVDTVFVSVHYKDGRLKEIIEKNNTKVLFEYDGCEKSIHTFLKQNGDTIQQVKYINKNNVLVKTKWTSFYPSKSTRVSEYYDYEFDTKGHWIKRKYKHSNKIENTETRTLIYY
ncbi:hypothetical protein [Psychroserpens damuponensis]|uniref:hypothetical protein n=1 Tax=Psychroserpens damuponensis TaxID=943936 RepID=UPI00058FEF9C|nr:hypothetical protein [Psychroserpens damuponensis]